jgi:hypothetical protein
MTNKETATHTEYLQGQLDQYLLDGMSNKRTALENNKSIENVASYLSNNPELDSLLVGLLNDSYDGFFTPRYFKTDLTRFIKYLLD